MGLRPLLFLALTGVLGACAATETDAAEGASAAEIASVTSRATYPIVLAHGFFGFEDFAGLDFATYFYRVKDHLATKGETVYTPAVDPFNDSVTRGEQLLAQVEDIVRTTGAKKVNLVGHSQGGLDARYVAHVRPDLVASVITIGTPHHGSEIADVVLGTPGSGLVVGLAEALVKLAGHPLWDASGNETSVARAFRQLSTAGSAEFNATYTDAPGIPYFSIAGRTAFSAGGDDCKADDPPAMITKYASDRDRTTALLLVPEAVLGGITFTPNDGLVKVSSARHGRFLGCIPADHLDEIGQPRGGSPGFDNDFDYLAFYDDLVHFLRRRGY